MLGTPASAVAWCVWPHASAQRGEVPLSIRGGSREVRRRHSPTKPTVPHKAQRHSTRTVVEVRQTDSTGHREIFFECAKGQECNSPGSAALATGSTRGSLDKTPVVSRRPPRHTHIGEVFAGKVSSVLVETRRSVHRRVEPPSARRGETSPGRAHASRRRNTAWQIAHIVAKSALRRTSRRLARADSGKGNRSKDRELGCRVFGVRTRRGR